MMTRDYKIYSLKVDKRSQRYLPQHNARLHATGYVMVNIDNTELKRTLNEHKPGQMRMSNGITLCGEFRMELIQ
jgi:hypothetical protein